MNDFEKFQFEMTNNLPDFSGRCTKSDVSKDREEVVNDNDNVDETKKDDNDDSVLLSQAMNEGSMKDFY